MSDDKVSLKEALDELYDLSWMIGSTAMEYLTDKDGEKIRDYIGVIDDRIDDLEKELSEFKKYFEPYDIDEANQTVIENGQAMIRGLRVGAIGKGRMLSVLRTNDSSAQEAIKILSEDDSLKLKFIEWIGKHDSNKKTES